VIRRSRRCDEDREAGVGVILSYNANQAGACETVESIERDGGTAVALPL
jgi:hypothetical protein